MKLHRSLLRSFLDSTIDVVAFKDRQGRYVAASRTLYEAFGFDSAEPLLGHDDGVLWPPEIAATRVAEDQEVARTGSAIGPFEEELPIGANWPEASWCYVTSRSESSPSSRSRSALIA
jgi:PAS domain-containing protein